ncbi:MAG: hypothetical protein PHQ42_00115 [Patescibacteria group bacterium]|nr:hypothetical protein [Patescibacteria group bacterium]
MKAFKALFVVIAILTVLVASVQAEEETLNVKIDGLNRVENYLVKSALTRHHLPLTTPISINKEVFIADWNGKEKEFDRITVGIETTDGKFTATLDTRQYPQLSEEYHYGLLELALSHACQGPEKARRDAELNKMFNEIRKEVVGKAERRNYRVNFPDKRQGETVHFRINNTPCEVDLSGDSLKYSMVFTDNVMRPVRDLEKILQIVPNI